MSGKDKSTNSSPSALPVIQTTARTCNYCGSLEKEIVGAGIDFEYETCSNEFTYVRCKSCGHHFIDPITEAKALGIIYPENYGNYHHSEKLGLAYTIKGWLEGLTLKKLNPYIQKQGAVLDIGCGDGRFLDIVKNKCPNVLKIEGVEIADGPIAAAEAKGYRVLHGSFENVSIENEKYDLMFMIQVFEHLYEPEKALDKIFDGLKPGGIVVIETPSVDAFDFKLFKNRYWGGYHFPRHFNLYTPKSLTGLLEKRGFALFSVKHKLQPVHWIWSFHHYLKEKEFPRGIVDFFHMKNPFLLAVFCLVDAFIILLFKKSSNMQIIAMRPKNV